MFDGGDQNSGLEVYRARANASSHMAKTATVKRSFAADLLQMQQTGKAGLNCRLSH